MSAFPFLPLFIDVLIDMICMQIRWIDDKKDLWAACVALGKTVEEYVLENDTYAKRFRRSDEWKEALTAIRRYVSFCNDDNELSDFWLVGVLSKYLHPFRRSCMYTYILL